MNNPNEELMIAIKAFATSPPNFATADRRGKFPMAALKSSEDGSRLDTVPLTHACTTESFEKIKELIKALRVWEEAHKVSA